MASSYIMITRYRTTPSKLEALCQVLSRTVAGRLLRSLTNAEAIEISAVPDDASLVMLRELAPMAADSEVADLLVTDVRRELLEYVEAPKPCDEPIPQTRYIQLRHVEVKPGMMAAYRRWREKTIFDVVRGNEAAEIFLAYHSVISGSPGVMFVAGFNAPIEIYNADFTSQRYGEIVRQAGEAYITGGEDGLYTEFYEAFDASSVAERAA